MPGYIIHLAVGKIYEQNNKIESIADFEKGIITPDMSSDKSKTHYGQYSSKPDLNKYIQENGSLDSYKEGYFLHLVTDYLFYNKFLKEWNPIIYEDYNKLNAKIIKKYGITIPREIEKIVQFKDGNTSFLNEDELYKFIDAVGRINVRQVIAKRKLSIERQLELQFE